MDWICIWLVRRRLPINVATRVGVIHMDDILVVDDFVKKAIHPLTPTIVAVPFCFQVGNPSALPWEMLKFVV